MSKNHLLDARFVKIIQKYITVRQLKYKLQLFGILDFVHQNIIRMSFRNIRSSAISYRLKPSLL